MLLLAILTHYKLFHMKLFLSIVDYFTRNYFWQFKAIIIYDYQWLLVVFVLGLLVVILLVVINDYFINGYWWLLVVILLMVIGGYSWLFY